VITRPLAQAGHLAEQLAELGATPVRFPVLAIFDIEDKRPVLDAAIRLETYDLVVFVSPNAVNKALDVMLQHRQWPAAVAAATLGRSSERELSRRGVKEIIAPQLRFDSEALLEAPELQQMTGKRVLICRGDGGRELLGDTLVSRGATVDYLMVYRNTPTFVPHARIAEQAVQFGLRRIIPTGPGDDGLISGLLAYFDSDGKHAKHSEHVSPI
jgi:uroporphyrinogen-III synthase